MLEKDVNTVIARSLVWGHKLPDPSKSDILSNSASKRPFDGFGIVSYNSQSTPLYWETKFSKKLQSFNLSRIADHQAAALTAIHSTCPSVYTWVIFAVHAGRGDLRLYVFDWSTLQKRYEEKNNILKRELDNFPYNRVKNRIVSFESVIDLTN